MSTPTSPVAIIVVTRNSERFIDKCIQSINNQTKRPHQIIISDTGSNDFHYLSKYETQSNIQCVYAGKDVGFCKGNNFAVQYLHKTIKYVLLLNPDAFLFSSFIEKAVVFMNSTAVCGVCTGTLLGYDINSDKPTGLYDSTGIQQKWYGKWYDRDQRSAITTKKYSEVEEVSAACGALMFCRKEALDETLLVGGNIFDPSFYMYKEDIDLSLRVKKAGWKVLYNPDLQAYHCRGWSTDRKTVAKKYRLVSAKNELAIHKKFYSPVGMAYSLAKYLAVKMLNI